jgi:hypothetical protein
VLQGKQAWAKRNRVKRQAHLAVNNAVRAGRLSKTNTCQVCQCARPLHGHHEDYSVPLHVTWVCTTCHRNIHKGIVKLGRQFAPAARGLA